MNVELELRWRVVDKPPEELPVNLIRLIDGVARGGNLQYAAREAQLSYRHAWGLIKHWEQRFGVALLVLEKGRGSELTQAGEALREVWNRTIERTAAALKDAAMQVERGLAGLTSTPAQDRVLIAASHGYGIGALAELLRKSKVEPELHFVGSEEALKRYAAKECEAAGFHLPHGKHGRTLWSRFQRYLDSRSDILLLVETRELGFMARPGTQQVDIHALARRKLKFQNRQLGSGSRLLFDLLMQDANVKATQINGYHDEEYTHAAVAAMIASGEADAGFGARAAAEKFNLAFWPEMTEKFLLAVSRENLQRKPIKGLTRLLSSPGFKRQLAGIPGTDPRGSGKFVEIKHVLSLIRAPTKGRDK